MATVYINNIFELYDVDTAKWYRDDIPIQIKELIEAGNQFKINSWMDHRHVVNAPEWLKDESYSITSDELAALGYSEQANANSVIVCNNPDDYPLHNNRNFRSYFGNGDLEVSLPQLLQSLNADMLFVAMDFDTAYVTVTDNLQDYGNINAVYMGEEANMSLTQPHVGPAIIFTSEEELASISHSTQLILNKLRGMGCRYVGQNNNKRVVITDASIDEGFFDAGISLFFKSAI